MKIDKLLHPDGDPGAGKLMEWFVYVLLNDAGVTYRQPA